MIDRPSDLITLEVGLVCADIERVENAPLTILASATIEFVNVFAVDFTIVETVDDCASIVLNNTPTLDIVADGLTSEVIVFNVERIIVDEVVDWACDDLLKLIVLEATAATAEANERNEVTTLLMVASATMEDEIERTSDRTMVETVAACAVMVLNIALTRDAVAGAVIDEEMVLSNDLTIAFTVVDCA